MPMAVQKLFSHVALTLAGTVRWGQAVPVDAPGVYAVSLANNPSRNTGLLAEAPISAELVGSWIERVPALTLEGQRPSRPKVLVDFLRQFWLADENILYIGKATCLGQRLEQFRQHQLGNRSPHAGGHWLKTLRNLHELRTFFCICDSAGMALEKEDAALQVFKSQVSPSTRRALYNPDNPIPFANRAHPQGASKQTSLRHDVRRRQVSSGGASVPCDF